MTTRYRPIAAALSLFLAVPAFAVDDAATAPTVTVHERMMKQILDLQNRSQAGQSIDHWIPIAAKMAVRVRESADIRLHAIVAGYDRAGLDWGITTHGAGGVPRPPLVATR